MDTKRSEGLAANNTTTILATSSSNSSARTPISTGMTMAITKLKTFFNTSCCNDGGGFEFEIDVNLSEEERHFYKKAYNTVDTVKDRKVHCTVCRMHIGTAPSQEAIIKMHPVLRVTHCTKCHDFYNSGEFSKGEDGSELYCRWCGQGGEVYCCSNCPYVFCKSCIVKNLSRGIVQDIEQNENWSCFNCSTKILWPLRAQHWALVNYIAKQKREIQAKEIPEIEKKQLMLKDSTYCCRLGKIKQSNVSDSTESLESVASKRSPSTSASGSKSKMIKASTPSPSISRLSKIKHTNISGSTESLESIASKRSHGSASSSKINIIKVQPGHPLAAKRIKLSNDEVVCTPDLLSMLEPDCQLTVAQRNVQTGQTLLPPLQQHQQQQQRQTSVERLVVTPAPKILNLQAQKFTPHVSSVQTVRLQPSGSGSNLPPPLVLRNTTTQLTPIQNPNTVPRRTLVTNTRDSNPNALVPVYHTINGYRIDLNTASRQDTFRLPNGKLIQVKRQRGPVIQTPVQSIPRFPVSLQQQQQQQQQHNWGQQQLQQQQQQAYSHGAPNIGGHQQYGGTSFRPMQTQSRSTFSIRPIQISNGAATTNAPLPTNSSASVATATATQQSQAQLRTGLIRHTFPETPFGQARKQLQEQVFGAMDICQHLIGKLQSLTNSNAYKQAHDYVDVKELYIHLSYLITYGVGRYQNLQDTCAENMRNLGFDNDASSLENGQVAAGMDYVRYGQLEDIDLFDTGNNSFHHQVYEYRKKLRANMMDSDILDNQPNENLPFNEKIEKTEAAGKTELLDISNDEEESLMTPMKIKKYMDPDENNENENLIYNDHAERNGRIRSQRNGGRSSRSEGPPALPTQPSPQPFRMNLSTEESIRRDEEMQKIDHKLTRLIEKYPAIWCTRHGHYGNFDVTRGYWKIIASHFNSDVDLKLRWKYIRKRFVRIEQRIRDGKKFSGYLDKATNFLINRNRDVKHWQPVDCGENDDDDDDEPIENVSMHEEVNEADGEVNEVVSDDNDGGPNNEDNEVAAINNSQKQLKYKPPNRKSINVAGIEPIEVPSMDIRIINFVKSNPILWHNTKSENLDSEERCRTLWLHFWRSMPEVDIDEIIDRWKYIYEMYKTFRLQMIRDKRKSNDLEMKYANYLIRLRFLSDEYVRNQLPLMEDYNEEDDTAMTEEGASKLQEMPDDGEFVAALVNTVRTYRPLWDKKHTDFYDIQWRERLWNDVANSLSDFGRDLHSIKLRWHMAKFCYQLHLRDLHHDKTPNTALTKYFNNLPITEMTYLDGALSI